MKAIVVRELGDPGLLRLGDVPAPVAGPGRVIIDVHAAGVNFFDTLIVRGKYQVKPPLPFVPGGEVSGTVAALGDGVTTLAVGQRVMANVGIGGYAERASALALAVQPISDAMTYDEAAAFPIAYGTAYVAVAERARLRPGETVLVTGAAGGVGLASVQVARALGGRVIALARGDAKLGVAAASGAAETIDVADPDWIERVNGLTDGRGADVVIENVGGEVFDGCTRCIAWGGRLAVVGFAGGTIPVMKMNRVLLKHISLVGVHFSPMLEREPEALATAQRDLIGLYEAGRLVPPVTETAPLEQLPRVLERLALRKTVGKVVMHVR